MKEVAELCREANSIDIDLNCVLKYSVHQYVLLVVEAREGEQ